MSKKPAPKTAVVAFKVEEELAEFLNKLPNKSAFIRKAIAAQLGMACPLCNGKGTVPRGLHDHYISQLSILNRRNCDGCGSQLVLPRDADGLDSEEQERMMQFLHGGPLYCNACFLKAEACGDCGWHIDAEKAEEHHREVHTH